MMKYQAFVAAFALVFVTSLFAQAQSTQYWDTNADAGAGGTGTSTPNGTWDSGITPNWNVNADGTGATTTWTDGNDAVFSAGGDATGSFTVTVSGAPAVHNITFEEGAVTTFTGGQLTLTGTTPTITIGAGAELDLNTALVGSTATDGVTLAGGGAGSVIKLGSASGANSYSGPTTVGLGNIVRLGAAGQIPDDSVLTLFHGSTTTKFDLNGFDETVRSIASTAPATGAPTIALGSNTLTINDQAGDLFSYGGLYTSSGSLSAAHGTIVKNGSGELDLTGFPTATGFNQGEIILNSGTIGVGQNTAFGGANSKLTINGGTVKKTGAGNTGANPSMGFIDIGGSFIVDINGANDLQFNGTGGASTTTLRVDNPTITVIGDTIVDGSKSTGTFILAGDIVDDGNIRGFTKSGPGTLTLGSKGNSYRGETTIQEGALNVRYQTNSGNIGTARIGDGNGRVNLSGGKLYYNGSTPTSTRSFTVTNPLRVTADSEIDYASTTPNLTDSAGVIFDFTSNPNGDAFDWTGGTLTFRHNGASQGIVYRPSFSRTGFNYAGPVVLTGNGTRQTVLQSTNTSGTQTWSGAISGNGGFRRVESGGETVFDGANTFTGGTIVDGGTLTVSGSNATFGGGDLTVNAGSAAISAEVANAIADAATLTLLGGGTGGVADTGFISLAAGINEHIAALVLNGVTQASGTYGALGSGATNINNEYFSGAGIITVAAAGLPGDYNNNGVVDTGDYVLWRKSPGTYGGDPAGYTTWRSNFSSPPGAGSGGGLTSGAVPEPGTLALLICAIASGLVLSGRGGRC